MTTARLAADARYYREQAATCELMLAGLVTREEDDAAAPPPEEAAYRADLERTRDLWIRLAEEIEGYLG